eukprot:Gb_17558 [translate_table: standard]
MDLGIELMEGIRGGAAVAEQEKSKRNQNTQQGLRFDWTRYRTMEWSNLVLASLEGKRRWEVVDQNVYERKCRIEIVDDGVCYTRSIALQCIGVLHSLQPLKSYPKWMQSGFHFAMEEQFGLKLTGFLMALMYLTTAYATLSPAGINYEVVALIAIKSGLSDPYSALESWDINSVDPCSWRMVTCSAEGSVSALGIPSQSLSGTLSPSIQNLTNLQSIDKAKCSIEFLGQIVLVLVMLTLTSRMPPSRLLQNNAISGQIPGELGKLDKLQTLDLSNNHFNGSIPSSLGKLKNLNYLLRCLRCCLFIAHLVDVLYFHQLLPQKKRLNNNSLSGPCPKSLANITGLTLLDLSYNNLSGSVPRVTARTFNIMGNPLICGSISAHDCPGQSPVPIPFSADTPENRVALGQSKTHKVAVAFGASLGCVSAFMLSLGLLIWWRQKHHQQIFFDVNEQHDAEVSLGHLKRFSFKELHVATDHFSNKNILGRGGFGIVYKGCLQDGTLVAVKRLKDANAAGGEIQFQTEVEMISLAVHRNLLRLCGFCTTSTERLLVYPYMPNGSVASRLRDHVHGKPALDWSTRKQIALGAARGLLYLHEQCDPKIIHRDVKAANILLDEDFEAVVGDFGLAKLLDHKESHVTTAVRGTVGHIAPEYLSTGQSSEKTDVFGFGILLLELITGQKALDFGRASNQKGVMLDWVKKLHQEKKLNIMVDKDLKVNFDSVELEEMVQVALLCTQFHPGYRPKMSEVVRMLEGDGLAERWEASQKVETPRYRGAEFIPRRYSELIEDSSLVVQAIELSGPR